MVNGVTGNSWKEVVAKCSTCMCLGSHQSDRREGLYWIFNLLHVFKFPVNLKHRKHAHSPVLSYRAKTFSLRRGPPFTSVLFLSNHSPHFTGYSGLKSEPTGERRGHSSVP